MPRIFNTSGSKLSPVTQRPSAHLTLRDTNSQGEAMGRGLRGENACGFNVAAALDAASRGSGKDQRLQNKGNLCICLRIKGGASDFLTEFQ